MFDPPPSPTEEWVARETQAGRDAYHAGTPYDFGKSLRWKSAWLEAAREAALKALAPAVNVTQPPGPLLVEVYARALLAAIEAVDHAISREEARPYLNGIFFDHDDGHLRLVATDGKRLIVRDLSHVPVTSDFAPFILPKTEIRPLLDSFRGHLGHVHLIGGDRMVAFVDDRSTVYVEPIDASYPDYRCVIPRDNDRLLALPTSVADAIRMLPPTHERGLTYVVFDGDQATCGDRSIPLPKPSPLKIAFNLRKLCALLNTFRGADQIEMLLRDDKTAALVRRDDTTYVLMPVMVI